jgi:hypothetical protein
MKRSDFKYKIDYGDDFSQINIWFMEEKIVDDAYCFEYVTDKCVEDAIIDYMEIPNDKMRTILAKNREVKLERINKE